MTHSAGFWTDLDALIIPKELVSDKYDQVNGTGDLLVQGFLDTLRIVQTMFISLDEAEQYKNIQQSEAYTRHLLYDFVRVLLLSNRNTLAEQENDDLIIWYHSVWWSSSSVRLLK